MQQPCSNLGEKPENSRKASLREYDYLQGFCNARKRLETYLKRLLISRFQVRVLGGSLLNSLQIAVKRKNPGVVVLEEHDVAEVFVLEDVHEVYYVGLKVYSGRARCSRSPSPAKVNVYTSCPSSRNSGTTCFQHQPPSHAPGRSTNVVTRTSS